MANEQSETRSMNIRRGSYDSLDIYEITKDELEILKQGSPNSIYLNFSIALLSIFISLLITMLTVDIESNRIFIFFSVVLVVTGIGGVMTLILWKRGQNGFLITIKKIEERIEKEYKRDNESITPLPAA